MKLRKHRIKVVAFGHLGTLVDDLAGLKLSALDVEGNRRGQVDLDELARIWRKELLLFYKERYEPWNVNLLDALETACEEIGITCPAYGPTKVESWVVRWPHQPDQFAIARVGRRFKTAILSQLDAGTLGGCLPNLARQPDLIVSSDLSRAYKPDLGYFRLLRVQLGIEEPDQLLIISAEKETDLDPAAELGYQILHVDRTGESDGPKDLVEAVTYVS